MSGPMDHSGLGASAQAPGHRDVPMEVDKHCWVHQRQGSPGGLCGKPGGGGITAWPQAWLCHVGGTGGVAIGTCWKAPPVGLIRCVGCTCADIGWPPWGMFGPVVTGPPFPWVCEVPVG